MGSVCLEWFIIYPKIKTEPTHPPSLHSISPDPRPQPPLLRGLFPFSCCQIVVLLQKTIQLTQGSTHGRGQSKQTRRGSPRVSLGTFQGQQHYGALHTGYPKQPSQGCSGKSLIACGETEAQSFLHLASKGRARIQDKRSQHPFLTSSHASPRCATHSPGSTESSGLNVFLVRICATLDKPTAPELGFCSDAQANFLFKRKG